MSLIVGSSLKKAGLEHVLDELQSVRWFAAVGEPLSAPEVSFEVERAADVEAASRAMDSEEWFETLRCAANEYLAVVNGDQRKADFWVRFGRELPEAVTSLEVDWMMFPLEDFAQSHVLRFLKGYLYECAIGGPGLFTDLVDLLRLGRVPCGIRGSALVYY